MIRDAFISECGDYRYWLTRQWAHGGQSVAWIMLNPSTADAEVEDATLRRCISFSKGWGYGRLVVLNLFALRATDPRRLISADDPVGPDNDYHIRGMLKVFRPQAIVVAWGSFDPRFTRQRREQVLALAGKTRSINCLGVAQGGYPLHPLRLRADTRLVPYMPG